MSSRKRYWRARGKGVHVRKSRSVSELQRARSRHLGPTLSASYKEPLKIVRGSGQYLYDERGRAYLDCVNNVCHVGHCHPHVVEVGQRQMALLSTNTRYLHDHVVELAERLTATLPGELSICYFVNSGSEANELALRMAAAHTGGKHVIALEHGYHGHTQALIDVSHYKFAGAGGDGAPKTTHVVPLPYPYRGPHFGYAEEAGRAYAQDVKSACESVSEGGGQVSAFLAESISGCGGQVVYPQGYLRAAYAAVREAGGVCIADEVQVGFGRVGSAFWGFELQGAVPDIVTMGKPMGNGHPLAAVVTTPAVAASFATGMEYFNTFGGNPVSCAIGLGVLDVIQGEGLVEHAAEVGGLFMRELTGLMVKHEVVGEVRGEGLFIGVELVKDRDSRTPGTALAASVIEELKQAGILLSTDGPAENVLKIKPPLAFTAENALEVVSALDAALTALA